MSPSQRPYHHGDLRRALVEEGSRLVAHTGHPSISVREVARSAGVTHAAAFHHFATREALLAAIAARGFTQMTGALRRALQTAATPRERLRALGDAYTRYARAHAPIYRLMFSAEAAACRTHQELRAAGDRMFRILVTAIVECQRTNDVRPGDPADLALATWSAVHGLASIILDKQLPDARLKGRTLRQLTSLVLDVSYVGLRPQRVQKSDRRWGTRDGGRKSRI